MSLKRLMAILHFFICLLMPIEQFTQLNNCISLSDLFAYLYFSYISKWTLILQFRWCRFESLRRTFNCGWKRNQGRKSRSANPRIDGCKKSTNAMGKKLRRWSQQIANRSGEHRWYSKGFTNWLLSTRQSWTLKFILFIPYSYLRHFFRNIL